jgi:hypothetical protein
MRRKLAVSALLVICLLMGGCTHTPSREKQINAIVRPYTFSLAGWEIHIIAGELRSDDDHDSATHDKTGYRASVDDYFTTVDSLTEKRARLYAVRTGKQEGETASLQAQIDELESKRSTLAGTVENTLAAQITDILFDDGIFRPSNDKSGVKSNFPPVFFRLEVLPKLLVLSPRDHIESIKEITLQPNMNAAEMESVEEAIDGLGLSAIVTDIGGLGGTYPTMVYPYSSLRFTVSAAAEEWLHQYLAFRPLGFYYMLDRVGISRNYDIATMNETIAAIVSQEIADQVLQKYYPDIPVNNSTETTTTDGFDFNREMREIRLAVDAYLVRGDISGAESFMVQKRDYLESQGYYIRKLNQAYFAFNGTYAASPTSVNPVGDQLRQLRQDSLSLKAFLDKVSTFTSLKQLEESLDSLPVDSSSDRKYISR